MTSEFEHRTRFQGISESVWICDCGAQGLMGSEVELVQEVNELACIFGTSWVLSAKVVTILPNTKSHLVTCLDPVSNYLTGPSRTPRPVSVHWSGSNHTRLNPSDLQSKPIWSPYNKTQWPQRCSAFQITCHHVKSHNTWSPTPPCRSIT